MQVSLVNFNVSSYSANWCNFHHNSCNFHPNSYASGSIVPNVVHHDFRVFHFTGSNHAISTITHTISNTTHTISTRTYAISPSILQIEAWYGRYSRRIMMNFRWDCVLNCLLIIATEFASLKGRIILISLSHFWLQFGEHRTSAAMPSEAIVAQESFY